MVAESNAQVDAARTGRLTSDIERTRAEIDATLDELSYRLTPSQILQRTMASCQRAAWKGAAHAANTARAHPLPTAVIGFGVLWLVRASMTSHSHRSPRTEHAPSFPAKEAGPSAVSKIGHQAAEAAAGAIDAVRQTASSTAHATAHAVESAGAVVTDAVRTAGSYIGEKASAVRGTIGRGTRQTAEWTDSFVHDYPLATAAACFAIGLVGALVVPGTRKEDEILGGSRDRVIDEAKRVGSRVLHEGERAVEHATQVVTGTVERQIDRMSNAGQT